MTASGHPTDGQIARHVVASDEAGERVDRCLAAALGASHPELSRSRIKLLIEQGNLRMSEAAGAAPATIDEPSYRVKPGQDFALTIPAPEAAVPQGQAIALSIVYEDLNADPEGVIAGLVSALGLEPFPYELRHLKFTAMPLRQSIANPEVLDEVADEFGLARPEA